MSENTLVSSMQDAPGAQEKARQAELSRLALKSFMQGSITENEANRILAGGEQERTWNPPSTIDELGYDPDELENSILNPGTGVGAYKTMLVEQERPAVAPEVAIPELFEKMKPYRKFLLAIMNACGEEATAEAIDAAVNPEYEFCACVYTPIALRKMLTEAGALHYLMTENERAAYEAELERKAAQNALAEQAFAERAPESGTDTEMSAKNDVQSPLHVAFPTDSDFPDDIDEIEFEDEAGNNAEITGNESDDDMRGSIYDKDGYLVIEQEDEGTWILSEAGAAYLDSIDPEKQFAAQLEKHQDIDDVFYDVITYCAETPRNITDIVNHFATDPRLGPQTYYASYVVDRLEEIGALTWEHNWVPTALGKKLLSERTTN